MQFTEEQMALCHKVGGCDKKAAHFIDCTRGPLYDPRFYCDEHIQEAKDKETELSNAAALRYQRSVVANCEFKLEDEKAKLAEMEEAYG